MKIWILFLCAVAVGVSAQSDELTGLDWDDDWKEYDDEWFRTKLEQLGIYNDEQNDSAENGVVGNIEKDLDEMDLKVEEEIKQFREASASSSDEDDKIDDYQFEDNRSEQREKLGDDDKAEPIHDIGDGINQDASLSENENDYDDYALDVEDHLEPNLPEGQVFEKGDTNFSKDDDIVPLPEGQVLEKVDTIFSKDDDVVPLPEPSGDEIQRIMDEAQAIINEEEQKSNDFSDYETMQENDEAFNKIIEETKDILEEETRKDNDFADGKTMSKYEDLSEILVAAPLADEDGNVINQDNDEQPNISQETVDAPEVTDEIIQDDDKSAQVDSDLSESIVDENEDTVAKVYEDLNADLDNLFETLDKLSRNENEDEVKFKSAEVDYAVDDDQSLDDKSDYENIFDSNLSDLFAEHSKAKDAEDEMQVKIEIDDESNKETEKVTESAEQVLQVPYINDPLLSEDKSYEKPVKSVNVDDLSDDQLVQLMKDFETQHSDVFDVEALSDDHVVNEITVEYGETKVITSENYPAGYPTNRVVDWIVTGNGQGIELNLTDFAVNSALGDYLMVKPGQVDDSGADGIIFSYHLNEPRAFRFMDVDKVFIRFDSKLGMVFLRGFSLTVKVIAPPAEEPEPEPEPEALLPEPRHSLTVMLGGLTLAEFEEISDQFRKLVADMATMYVNTYGVDPGMNTTAEITQIISASICNVQWPGFEKCAQVTFSVPLVYEDDDAEHRLNETDLQNMWGKYVETDPFAARLRQMGIEEFTVPNDGGVLTVWLVVALGVLVSAAMMAFALWRYSCSENYSRMPAFSDTDSLDDKRSSALYPTPHQMLPPLYADKDYDSTRLDMGGHTNPSYFRTDMYDLDSDEDAVPRDRNAGIQPRDIFSV